ncbi:MAG: WD40 repeat domain-containing protein, partial [Verrucomicrobiota bacterium]
HAAWQILKHGTEGLAEEIPTLKPFPLPDLEEQMTYVINGIGGSDAREAIHQASNFIAGDHEPEELLRRTILWVNTHCQGNGYYAGQRAMIDAWSLARDHPDRNQILLALTGWMADYRNQHYDHEKSYGPVWGANLSADGSLAAIRSDGTRLFDTHTGEEIHFSRGHPWRFAFHPGGRLLACGWDGGKLEIRDLITKERVREIEAFPGDVTGQFGDGKFWGLQFSPDGTMLAGCSRGCHEVKIWDTATWELKFELAGHTHDRNESVTFSANNRIIATGGNDGTVRIWDAKTGEVRLVFEGHSDKTGRLTAVDFHPDGDRILSAESASEILVWDWRTGEVHLTLQGKDYCNFAGFSADGKTLIGEHSGTLSFWDATTGKLEETIVAIPDKDQHVLFGGANLSRDRRTLITAGWMGRVRIWDIEKREARCSFKLDVT